MWIRVFIFLVLVRLITVTAAAKWTSLIRRDSGAQTAIRGGCHARTNNPPARTPKASQHYPWPGRVHIAEGADSPDFISPGRTDGILMAFAAGRIKAVS